MAYISFTGNADASNGTSLSVLNDMSSWSSAGSGFGGEGYTSYRYIGFRNDSSNAADYQNVNFRMSTDTDGTEHIYSISATAGTGSAYPQIVSIVGISISAEMDDDTSATSNLLEANRVVSRALLGNDVFDLSGTISRIWGDMENVAAGGSYNFGNDLFIVGTSSAANFTGYVTLYGDARTVASGGTAHGGDDTVDVTASTGPMKLFGDFEGVATGATVTYGDDTLRGSGGADYLYGDSIGTGGPGGADFLYAASGNDYLYGGGGNDTLAGGFGSDALNGGAGFDVASYSADSSYYASSMVVDLANSSLSTGTAQGDTFTYIEGVRGRNLAFYADDIRGNNAVNALWGQDGNDTLVGRGGDDSVFGGVGDDYIYGGTGNDRLGGGSGSDHFVFDTAPSASNADTIVDFKASDDTVLLDNAVMSALGATLGVLKSYQFYAGTSGQSHDASDRVVYETDTGRLYYDEDGTGSDSRVLLATLTGKPSLTYQDFEIV